MQLNTCSTTFSLKVHILHDLSSWHATEKQNKVSWIQIKLTLNMNEPQNILRTCTILITFYGWQSFNNIAAIISFAVSVHRRTRQTWNKYQLHLLYGKYGNSLEVWQFTDEWYAMMMFRINEIKDQIEKARTYATHRVINRIFFITYHKQGSWCWHPQEESHGGPWQPTPWHWWKFEDFYSQLSIFWFH